MLLPTSCGPGPPAAAAATILPPLLKFNTKYLVDDVKVEQDKAEDDDGDDAVVGVAIVLADYHNDDDDDDDDDDERNDVDFCTTNVANINNNNNKNTTNSNNNKAANYCIQQQQQQQQEQAHLMLQQNNNKKLLTATTTSITASASAAPKWLLMSLMLFTILAQTPQHQVAAEKSKHYHMQQLCRSHFLQQLYRKIDGAVLWSQNERNLDCIITFQTHSILQRFMLRFDMLQLDCNDHLFVYDGAHAVAAAKIDISCRNTKQAISSFLTRTNFVTLKYVTDGWGTDANGFKLVITSVKDPKHTCKDFICTTREFCISPDLLCDGINHCGDDSDESVQNLCQSEATSAIFGVDMTWFVLIVVCVLLILSAIIVGISICVCRRQQDDTNQNTAVQMHIAETNGSSKHLHYHHGGTLTREHTQLPQNTAIQPYSSGNWHHPAGPSGYHRTPHNLLKMATKVRPIWCLANSVN